MPTPQAAIFPAPAAHHLFLEYALPGLNAPPGDAAEARAVKAALGEARRWLAGQAGVGHVLAFGPGAWAALAPGSVPAGLQPFRPLLGRGGKRVPATQHDLWWWLSGGAAGRLLAAGLELNRRLAPWATLRLEQAGFTYLDSRDLTGFVDGTANPGPEEAPTVALVPAGQPGAGGSHVLAMRWLHDLAAFHALPTREQERVIGRGKADSEELSGADMPADAHVSRMEIEQDGEELAIHRRSVPFGGVNEHGLMFVAFAHEPARYDLMLRRMYGLDADGLEDRLTNYSRPTHAAYYFAPSEEDLAATLG